MAAILDTVEPIAPAPNRSAILLRIMLGRPATIFAALTIAVFVAVAVMAPWIAPYNPLAQSILKINQTPSWAHWLGTDQFGRDVLSRMIYGSRNSLIFGLLSPALAAMVGTTLGVVAGYFGGVVDRVISRLVDLLLAFPELLLAIIIAAALGGGFWNVVAVLTVAFVPGFARVARAQTLSVKQEPYIEAAIAVGVSTPVIIFRHILPNISAPIVVLVTLWVASAIRLEASLSFLGLGTQPPNPSWGNIIRDGLNNLFGSPWPIIGAGFAITCVVLAFNLFGDAMRDALDPETAA
ncbi:peptide/nickel transport system permease protein [Inquilinus ginsengisoli]|uniref:Peptide/nickel transport system permease protein n=1 Tax=Inquilinus ginsengisoli TaxID=363840 RepID=A0ABU1JN83_9PROT|nr:ABC transporter permease [Inquilinus ginsengisoli]MDR6290071.1 peptide/nickel transport system permease protein [Inquilinus ginsengisoli]